MNKVIFLIDGFNIYHSILQLKRQTGHSVKWLDLSSLCTSYLYLFGKDSKLESIHYFSALPYYLSPKNPRKIERHRDYIDCLQSSGINVELGRFKEKEIICKKCHAPFFKYEEKETDVAIAVKLIEACFSNACDTAVIVSGDTDLSPAARKCKLLFPNKKIIFAFPYARKNKELSILAPGSFTIGQKQYIKYQFPNSVELKNGRKILKPPSW